MMRSAGSRGHGVMAPLEGNETMLKFITIDLQF